MRNKVLNNNLSNTISKGGVLYRPGEIPTLTKEQIAQANLVSKLPRDFPIANWESMSARQQLQQMKNSGLNEKDQWSLLNLNVPLAALNQYNQAQTQSEITDLATKVVASLVSATAKAAVPLTPTPGNNSSNYTPLLGDGVPHKTNAVNEEYKKTPIGKASGNASGGTGGAILAKGTVQAELGSKIMEPASSSTNSPLKNGNITTPSIEIPRSTPSPSPTPLPLPGPSPEIDVRKIALLDRLKQKVNDDLNIIERVKGYNTTRSALSVVFENDAALERMASQYDVPKSVLQTIMFREQRFVDIRDTAADFLTGIGLREQSSTGLMQVTTKTAIDAINYSVDKGYTSFNNLGISSDAPLSYTDINDRSSVWSLLKSDSDFNIEVAAQIVRMNADKEIKKENIEDYSEADLVKLLALYNGRGDAAREYGEECFNWYQDFSWYN